MVLFILLLTVIGFSLLGWGIYLWNLQRIRNQVEKDLEGFDELEPEIEEPMTYTEHDSLLNEYNCLRDKLCQTEWIEECLELLIPLCSNLLDLRERQNSLSLDDLEEVFNIKDGIGPAITRIKRSLPIMEKKKEDIIRYKKLSVLLTNSGMLTNANPEEMRSIDKMLVSVESLVESATDVLENPPDIQILL